VRLRRINPSLLKWGKITANFTLKISPTSWRKETKETWVNGTSVKEIPDNE
jgi:hypothetical protein